MAFEAKDGRDWLTTVIPLHARLSVALGTLVENIIKTNEIEYLSISARTKTIDGALEKIRRKDYDDPQSQLTDLSGVRIVTYLEEHATQISNLIKGLFEIDEANSHDRSADLGEDKIGYRSTHFVCTLGTQRGTLPEYNELGELKFEVQIRTVLQHAWAELAHDRSFKFGAALPTKIQRKLNLYSGLLEIVDGAFDEIAREISDYKAKIDRKSIKQISTTEINSFSLGRFLSELSNQTDITIADNIKPEIIEELRSYGLTNIGDVEALATPDFKNTFRKSGGTTSYGMLRHLMIYQDIDRYFKLGRKFGAIDQRIVEILETKYTNGEVQKWLKKLDIRPMHVG
ncbi:MAG: hypothetical protein WBB98_13085 [Xanthobacteraceae bacterium]